MKSCWRTVFTASLRFFIKYFVFCDGGGECHFLWGAVVGGVPTNNV